MYVLGESFDGGVQGQVIDATNTFYHFGLTLCIKFSSFVQAHFFESGQAELPYDWLRSTFHPMEERAEHGCGTHDSRAEHLVVIHG